VDRFWSGLCSANSSTFDTRVVPREMRAAALRRAVIVPACRSTAAITPAPASHTTRPSALAIGVAARRDRSAGATGWSQLLVTRPLGPPAALWLPRGSRSLSGEPAVEDEDDVRGIAAAAAGGYVLADSDPSTHRPGDEGKVYPLYKEALKEAMPEGLAGLMHRMMFGSRNPYASKEREKWYDMILKNKPGMLIRKQSTELISALHSVSRQGMKAGKPTMDTPGFLLDGPPGTGKSMILNHVVHWARARGDWIVVFIPDASRLVIGYGFYQRGTNEHGPTILQPAYAQTVLEQMMASNGEKLKEIEVALPDGETNAADAIGKLLALPMQSREDKAVDTFLAVMEGLRKQTKYPLLIAVDEINALCGMSLYPTEDGMDTVLSSQIVVAEQFSRFLNNDLARGVVVGAATRTGQFENLKLPAFTRKPIQVRGFTREELSAYLSYTCHQKELFTPATDDLLDYLLFTAAGRPALVERLIASELFNIGQFNMPKTKKIGRWYRETGGTSGMFNTEHLRIPGMMKDTLKDMVEAASAGASVQSPGNETFMGEEKPMVEEKPINEAGFWAKF
jgi:hypothetical protein